MKSFCWWFMRDMKAAIIAEKNLHNWVCDFSTMSPFSYPAWITKRKQFIVFKNWVVEHPNSKDLFCYCKTWNNEKKVNLCSKGAKWNKLKFVSFSSDDNFDLLLFPVHSKSAVENGAGGHLLCHYVIIYTLIVHVFRKAHRLHINDLIYKISMFTLRNNPAYSSIQRQTYSPLDDNLRKNTSLKQLIS